MHAFTRPHSMHNYTKKQHKKNTCASALEFLNEEITSDIKHKRNTWNEHIEAHCDHMNNTHTMHGLSNRTPPTRERNTITFNNKITITPKQIANCFTITKTVRHATHKTNISIGRAT